MDTFTLVLILVVIYIAMTCVIKIYEWLYVVIHKEQFNGYGLLNAKAIDSFLNCKCGTCSNKIPPISLGNSVMLNQDGPVEDTGFIFKCAECRGLNLPPPEKNIGRGATDSLKSSHVNGMRVIYELIRAIKGYKRIDDDLEKWLIALHFFRAGVFGLLQSGEFSRQWYEAERYVLFQHTSDADIPHNCPECGLCIGTGVYEDDYYDLVKKQGYCSSCEIPLNEMWTFRENTESDSTAIKNILVKRFKA